MSRYFLFYATKLPFAGFVHLLYTVYVTAGYAFALLLHIAKTSQDSGCFHHIVQCDINTKQ